MSSTFAGDPRAPIGDPSPNALDPLAALAPAFEVSVVVPLFNEEPSLRALYGELAGALEAGFRWEVVFVDDGSTDGSYRELSQLHDAFDNVRVIRLRRNFGKAAALAAGFE